MNKYRRLQSLIFQKKYVPIKQVNLAENEHGDIVEMEDGDSKYAVRMVKDLEAPKGKRFIEQLEIYANVAPHPALNRFVGYTFVPKAFVFEAQENGSLKNIFAKEAARRSLPPTWNITQKTIIVFGVATAMMHLHAHKVVHKNLKPSNILLDHSFEPKVADIGYVSPVTEFTAPEGPGDYPADVFSFGVIVDKLFPGGNDGFITAMKRACVRERPEDRPRFAQIVYELKKRKDFIEGMDQIVFDAYKEKCLKNVLIEPRDVALLDMKTGEDGLLNTSQRMRNAKQDFAILKKRAEAGDPQAMVQLGRMYQTGNGTKVNPEEAVKYMKMAADNDYAYGNYNYGYCLAYGFGIEKNMQLAKAYLLKAASQRVHVAPLQLGEIAESEGNYDEALGYFREAGKLGCYEGMFRLGRIYEKRNELEMAAIWYQRSGENGVTAGICDYARCLMEGTGVAKDEEEAVRLFKKASELGDNVATINLAAIYQKGLCGILENQQVAASLFRKAADAGSPVACRQYATMLMTGKGVDRDVTQAVDYYEMAAEKEDIRSIFLLSRIYLGNECKDEARGIELLKLASDMKHPPAMLKYAECLQNGMHGVQRSPLKAISLLEDAARGGYKPAIDALAELDK